MKIEILYPELCNLYGDPFNIRYLMSALRENSIEAELAVTSFGEPPAFVDGSADFVYLGGMSETTQRLVADELRQYRSALADYIEDEKFFLATGNAVEIFGQGMESEHIPGFEGLNFFPSRARIDLWKRHNSFFVGEFSMAASDVYAGVPAGSITPLEVVGFKSQFGHSYWEEGADVAEPFILIKKGVSFDGRPIGTPESSKNESASSDAKVSCAEGTSAAGYALAGEGVRIKNFMGTYAIGPLLVLNPLLTKVLIGQLGKKMGILDVDIQAINLPFEKESMDAYQTRLAEFKEPNRCFEKD